jgi:hypothetical protein
VVTARRTIVALALAAGVAATVPPMVDVAAGQLPAWSRAARVAYFVSPTGRASGTGTINQPWDLATALAHPAVVKPGDVIWLLGGRYRGTFTSKLTGTATDPIVVRQYSGQQATIDGDGDSRTTLTIRGASTWFWGFEVTDSDPRRVTQTSSSHPADLLRGDGIAVYGPNVKLINLVIHDAADGVGLWTDAVGAEVYGCIVYHNGWVAPDRGHGQGLYIQNEQGTKVVSDVISFRNFSTGMKAYSEQGPVVGVEMDGIVSFDNGAPASGGDTQRDANIFIGTTERPADRITVTNSFLYYPPQTDTPASLLLGYTSPSNKRIVVKNNYIAGGNRALRLRAWESAAVTGNMLFSDVVTGASQRLVTATLAHGARQADFEWNANTYRHIGSATTFSFQDRTATFAGWQQASGFDRETQYAVSRPTGVQVFVRPNKYVPGRANIIVYNWNGDGQVALDLTKAGLNPGDRYEIRDAQNYFGAPIATGVFDGRGVTVGLTGLTAVPPVGSVPYRVTHTGPAFAALIVEVHQDRAVPRGSITGN